MSEILTESFCERCGTRYTFESARPKKRLKGVKVLSLGLKNFVLSDETSLDEAMAAARSETDRELTAHQLDAFHKTFNFCMSCRQYTCPNCWNEADARCLSCAPLPGQAPSPAPFPGLTTLGSTLVAEPSSNGATGRSDEMAADLVGDVILAGPGLTEPETVVAVEPEVLAEVANAPGLVEPEAIAAAEPEAVEPVEAESVAAVEPAILETHEKAVSQTADLLRRFRPGQSLDEELAAYELERAVAEARPVEAAEPVAQADAAVAPAAEPVANAPEPIETAAAAAQVEPAPVAPASAADVVEQPTWRIPPPEVVPPRVRPPVEPEVVRPISTTPPPPSTAPQWPARPAAPPLPDWPPRSALGSPFQPGAEGLWAASNQELVGTPLPPGRPSSGIQPCLSCGLSLSANARFCRRCGTLQAG